MNYGVKSKNPMDHMLFYTKKKPDETFFIPGVKVAASQILNSATLK